MNENTKEFAEKVCCVLDELDKLSPHNLTNKREFLKNIANAIMLLKDIEKEDLIGSIFFTRTIESILVKLLLFTQKSCPDDKQLDAWTNLITEKLLVSIESTRLIMRQDGSEKISLLGQETNTKDIESTLDKSFDMYFNLYLIKKYGGVAKPSCHMREFKSLTDAAKLQVSAKQPIEEKSSQSTHSF